MALEVLFPILFYDLLYAITDPEQQSGRIASFLSSRPMVFVGEISMCVYMIHLFVAAVLGIAVGKPNVFEWPWWSVLVVIPVSLLLGALLTHFFEKPCGRLLQPGAACPKTAEPPGDSAQELDDKGAQQPNPRQATPTEDAEAGPAHRDVRETQAACR